MAAERRAGIVRIVVAAVLLATVLLAVGEVSHAPMLVRRQIEAAQVSLTLVRDRRRRGSWLAYRRLVSRWLAVATATADAVIIFGNLAYDHLSSGVAGNFFYGFPVVWVIPIAIAASAIHYRPRLQMYVAGLYFVGLIAVVAACGQRRTGGAPTGRRRAVSPVRHARRTRSGASRSSAPP